MRVLMCPPEFFDVTYEINAWMRVSTRPDAALARAQWAALRGILEQRMGAVVEIVAPRPEVPDMVFTANAGLVCGSRLVPSRFRFAERQREVPYYIQWFSEHGFEIFDAPDGTPGSFEGEGDALYYGDMLLAGYRQRSDASFYGPLAAMLGRAVLPLELVDKRWYHLDTCLVPLRSDLLAYYPPAFDEYAQRVLIGLPGEKIILSEHDALRFGANAVVIGDSVVMNTGCPEFEAALAKHGFTVYPTDLSEFLKSGGAAKCLTLMLDHGV